VESELFTHALRASGQSIDEPEMMDMDEPAALKPPVELVAKPDVADEEEEEGGSKRKRLLSEP
jgi:hypothetical protein